MIDPSRRGCPHLIESGPVAASPALYAIQSKSRAVALPERVTAWWGLADARAAVNAGVLSLELARENVLLAYRSPLGAQGLLAIPRERYDAFKLIEALEGTP